MWEDSLVPRCSIRLVERLDNEESSNYLVLFVWKLT